VKLGEPNNDMRCVAKSISINLEQRLQLGCVIEYWSEHDAKDIAGLRIVED
jgi:hypothetical protein